MNPKKHCPRCGKQTCEPGTKDAGDSVPVYCVRTCLEEVAIGAETYWRAKP